MQPAPTQHEDRSKRPASDEGYFKIIDDSASADQIPADDIEDASATPWRALFFFTTKANLPVLIAGIVISTICGAISPAQSFVAGKVFEKFSSYAGGTIQKDEFMKQEKKYISYLLILASVVWLSFFLDLAAWIAFGELQAKSARDRLFSGLLKKEIEWYDMRKNGIGALLPRLQSRIRELQLATSQPLGTLISAIATAVFSLVQAFVLSWKLTLVTISTVPIVMIAIVWIGGGIQSASEKQGQQLTAAQKHVTSALSAIETVKCFNAQEIEQQNYMACVLKAASWYYRAANANALQMGLMVLLSSTMFVQGFYYGDILATKGENSVADVITTFLSAVSALQAVNAILPQLIVMERGRLAGSILRTVMAQVREQTPDASTQGVSRPSSCYGDIVINSLTFAYPSRLDLPAIRDLSIFIPGGDTTFIIGGSGSGKSTLGQLLMRFYSISQGHITLDGNALDTLDMNWLRSNITLVEQTSLLFNDTIFRNIAFGKHNDGDVTKREVMEAAEFALLRLTINDIPDGVETQVGYKGSAMSGGQRQRMVLARARLRDTPILILDECTSALDRISRSLMMDAIRKWRRRKTTIIITHDISQILPNDYVYILEHGRLVQEGYRQHIERLKDTPFQDFLPEELRAASSPFDARKGNPFEFIKSRDSSVDSEANRLKQISSDPLEAQLKASENRRATFLPKVFEDGSPLPALGTRRNTRTSNWIRIAMSPSEPIPGALWSGWWARQADVTSGTLRTSGERRKHLSSDLTHLLSRTGSLAVESRSAASTRRPVELRNKKAQVGLIASQTETSKLADSIHPQRMADTGSRSLQQILSTIWPNINLSTKMVCILGFWGSTIHAVSSPVFSFVFSKLLHLYSTPKGDKHMALIYSMAILSISVVDAFHTYLSHFLLEYVGQRWVDNIRSKAMSGVLDQPLASFEKEENAVSRLTGCLDRNAEEMRNILGRFLSLIWMAVVMSAVSVTWAIVAQWKMTLIALATAPYIYGVTRAYAGMSERWEKLCNDATEDAASIFTETFTNIKTVRGLTLEQHFMNKYLKATNYALATGFRRAFFTGFFYGLSDSAGNFSMALMFYVGAKLVSSGASVEHIMQVLVMLIFAITNIEGILGYIPQIGSSKDTASRLLRLLELPKDSHEHLGDAKIVSVGDIKFDDFQFSYPSRPEQSVLKHLNLHIAPGTSTAIVGGSGSGKSTVANLILNLYSTASNSLNVHDGLGSLMLAGRDINLIETTSLRSLIIPVSQTPSLFSATVAENIAYGLPLDSPYNNYASISAAAQQAGIHGFINSLPQGYSTPIGDGGVGLSGGQAQRIAIARALLRKPAVLILDEATSALDVESANLVRETIEKLVEGRDTARKMTVIIITHSREMMEIAENVVVLDQGRVVEEGAFEELVNKNGSLSNLLSGGEWTSGVED